jgi:methyl-accepting chemotaxis protein
MTGSVERAKTEQASVVAATNQANDSVATAAAASRQLLASIREIATRVDRSSTIARAAVGDAKTADDRIEGLAGAVERIGAAGQLISQIAGQTNLLALNATIEAARAGEAGKGFAVVAGEVKNLASQTARATEEIAAQLAAVRSETSGAVEAIRAVGAVIADNDKLVAEIARAVEGQGHATGEIDRQMQEVSASTGIVASGLTNMSQTVDQTEASSSVVSGAAADLQQESRRLKESVERFLKAVRAA